MTISDIKISRYPDIIRGIVLRETEQWCIVCYNPVDYVLDGYMFINRDYIKQMRPLPEDSMASLILFKKYHDDSGLLDDIEIDKLFASLSAKGSLAEIGLDSQDYCLIGTIGHVSDISFVLNTIGSNAEALAPINLKPSKVRYVTIASDYLRSLDMYIRSNRR